MPGGGVRGRGERSRPLLRRERTGIGAESRTSWVEFEKSNLSLLDDEVSLRSSNAKDEEEKSVIGKEDASVYTVEDDRHGFDFDDDDGGHSSDSSLDLHTPLVRRNFHSQRQHH